jgi:hypothetical protein
MIPTGVSNRWFGAEKTVINPDWGRSRPELPIYMNYLQELFVDSITVRHTRDRTVANKPEFAEVLRSETGIFLGPATPTGTEPAYLLHQNAV